MSRAGDLRGGLAAGTGFKRIRLRPGETVEIALPAHQGTGTTSLVDPQALDTALARRSLALRIRLTPDP